MTCATLPLAKSVLITFASDFNETGKTAARLAHQIRIGIKPADIPFETAEVFLTVNAKTAEKIGVHIPDEILIQAHKIIH